MASQHGAVVQVPPENVTVVQSEPPAEHTISHPTSFYCAPGGQQQQQQQHAQAMQPAPQNPQVVVLQPMQMTGELPSTGMAVDDHNEAKLGYIFLVLGWLCCLAGVCVPAMSCFMGLWFITPLMHLCRATEDRTRFPRTRRAAKFNFASVLCIASVCMMFIVAHIVCVSEEGHNGPDGRYHHPHHHGPHHYGPHEPGHHHHGPHHGHDGEHRGDNGSHHHGHGHHHGHHDGHNTTASAIASAPKPVAAVAEGSQPVFHF